MYLSVGHYNNKNHENDNVKIGTYNEIRFDREVGHDKKMFESDGHSRGK